ncbi:hypothetical protein [Roseofilum casamattae]|uniref:Uncharacterized protein n=1 Tax=Roseofilum casamattae BLCC-M143 TaxID=3022442 RepID=A0ABT7BU46_9CYAN|nr:hypothetical protein [Roseofilum casamattae]MDJ1182703.1 hypothetical protein [Roseofilum casamattae BLCC-M143]
MLEQLPEMLPPWEEFPTYKRDTIGWRMGTGERYLKDWFDFINTVPKNYESRLAYLKRHRPAPLNWGNWVLSILYPDVPLKQRVRWSEAEHKPLIELGLIEEDAAYQTWVLKQSDIQWPWQLQGSRSPAVAARYRTRKFWFFSRQFNANRQAGELSSESVPGSWKEVETELLTGLLGNVDPSHGLLALAKMLCAGSVQPPWVYGLSPAQCTSSFEMDMGFCDAYQLWLMSAFDDNILLQKMLESTGVPSDWTDWIEEHTKFGR